MLMKKPLSLILALALLAATGCAARGGDDYSNQQEGRAMTVQRGTVTGVRGVTTSNSAGGVGAIAGGALGGVLGSFIGGGAAKAIGAVGGALGGAAAGAGAEKALRDHDALEITIMLDSGRELVVVQDPDIDFQQGDRVRLLTASDGSACVQREQ